MTELTIEPTVATDPRVRVLARLLSIARCHAIGCLVEVWRAAFAAGSACLPADLIDEVAELSGFAAAMADAHVGSRSLATLMPDGTYRIAGVASRLRAKEQRREAGKSRAATATRKGGRFSRANPGDDTRSPPPEPGTTEKDDRSTSGPPATSPANHQRAHQRPTSELTSEPPATSPADDQRTHQRTTSEIAREQSSCRTHTASTWGSGSDLISESDPDPKKIRESGSVSEISRETQGVGVAVGPIPAGWLPSESLVKSLVLPAGVDFDHELLAFRAYYSPRPYEDWDDEFALWLKRARPVGRPRLRLVAPSEPLPSVPSAEERSRELREVLAESAPELLLAVEREGGT